MADMQQANMQFYYFGVKYYPYKNGRRRYNTWTVHLRDFLIRLATIKVPRAAAPPARAMPIYPSVEIVSVNALSIQSTHTSCGTLIYQGP
jgi:hypothetical protein